MSDDEESCKRVRGQVNVSFVRAVGADGGSKIFFKERAAETTHQFGAAHIRQDYKVWLRARYEDLPYENGKYVRDLTEEDLRLLQESRQRLRERLDVMEGTAKLLVASSMAASMKPMSISRPPGHNLVRLLSALLSKRRFERIFGQTIADARQEHCEALKAGDKAEAKKLARELNYDILKICFEWFAGWPAAVLSKMFKRSIGSGE